MKNIFKTKNLLVAAIIGLFALASCNSEDFLGTAPRLFRPIIQETSYGGTWIKLEWDKYSDAKSYQLQLSVDSFKTVFKDVTTEDVSYTFTELDYDTKYQVRIKSLGTDIASEFFVGKDVTTSDYPTKLITPTSSDVVDVAAKVSWTSSDLTYSKIDVFKNDTLVKSVPLTDTDNRLNYKIVSGLSPQKTYVMKIYSGSSYCGKKTYKTTTSENYGTNTVDLRSISDTEAYTKISQTFVDSICALYPSGVNVILNGGSVYKIETVQCSRSISFITGLSLSGKAIMAVNGNFGIASAAETPSVKFEKIFFTDGTVAGKYKTDANYGGTYLFNLNQSGAKAQEIGFNNCIIKYKRGIIRMQTTAQVATVNMTNCVMDSIGGYGVVNNANDASYVGSINIANSTIAHADKVLVCGKALGVNSVTMQNVTTCYTPANSTSYILDYYKNTIPGGIVLKNCLFGAGQDVTLGVCGMRSSCSNITVDKCYRASDLKWYTPDGATAPSAPISDAIDCGLATDALFKAPKLSNFTITSSLLVNKIGDPRWW